MARTTAQKAGTGAPPGAADAPHGAGDTAHGAGDSPHAMGIAPDTKEDLRRRLARVRGQVEGIARMVEEERYCPEILQQFAAVNSALRAAEKRLLANHLERCASHALAGGGATAAQVRRELVDLFHRYLR